MIEMQEQDRFFALLTLLGEFFCDPLCDTRQRVYWQLFNERCTIEAWEWACYKAMDSETFHKVPLPAVMSEYLRAYTRLEQEVKQRVLQDQRAREELKYRENPPLAPDELQEQLQRLFTELELLVAGLHHPVPSVTRRTGTAGRGGNCCAQSRLLAQARLLQEDAL